MTASAETCLIARADLTLPRLTTATPRDDDALRVPSEHRMLYVLALGLAGAIVADAVVFAYFALCYALG
jgi:hypothetical protein